jgi:SAM-dependent methyltransferase
VRAPTRSCRQVLHADATQVGFPPSSFDAVVSLYAPIHMPLDEQRSLLDRIGRRLGPGGWFLGTTGHRAWTGAPVMSVVPSGSALGYGDPRWSRRNRTVIGQASAAAAAAYRTTSALANECSVPGQVRASTGVPAARRAAMNCS